MSDDPPTAETPDEQTNSLDRGDGGSAVQAGGVDGGNREPDPFRRTALITGVAVVFGLLVTVLVTSRVPARGPASPTLLTVFLQVKLFVSTFNIVVLLALVSIYGRLYRDMPNQFTLSLVLISIALFLYAFTSNPVVHRLFGFSGGPGLGPFTVLPDLFASVAIIVLLYQSYK